MNGVLTGTMLVLLWGMALVRLPTLWRDARQRAVWATITALALAKTVATPGVNPLLAGLVPQPQIIPHLLGVGAAYFLLRVVCLITDYDAGRPRAARYQALLAGSVVLLLTALAAATPGGIRTRGAELMSTATAPAATAYWVVLNGYLGTILVITTVLFWRVGRSAPAGPLRDGLRAIAAGSFLIALYAVLKIGLMVAYGLGATVSVSGIEPVANGLRTLGTILAVLGAAVPGGGKLRTIVRAYRGLRAVRPLWQVMRRTFPDVILFSRRRALIELAGVDDVQLRLYRRIIEIRDGLLTLRDYLPAGALAEARVFAGENPALIEACGIALALRRHRAGVPPAAGGERWADVRGDVADEVAWLSAVSTAFRREEPAAFARRHDTVPR